MSTGVSTESVPSTWVRPSWSVAFLPVLLTFVSTVAIQIVWLLIDPRLRFFSDSGVYIISAESFLDPRSPLPLYRERSNLFTALWSPFLETSYPGLGIIIINGAVVAVAAALFCATLIGRGFTRLQAAVLASLTASLPSVIYFQHVALSEASAFAATLVWVSMVLWADARPSMIRFAAVGALTGVLATTVRTSFTLLLTAFLGALVLRTLVRALNQRRSAAAALGRGLLIVLTTGITAGVGLVAGSATQGALSQAPATQQLRYYMTMSGFNLIFKFGELEDCVEPSASPEESAVCSVLSLSRENAYDTLMWTDPLRAAWATSSAEQLGRFSDAYGTLARQLVLNDPQGALQIMVRDAWRMVNPLEHPRFTESTTQHIVASPEFPESASSDVLYRASQVQDVMRLVLIITILISLFVLGLGRFAGTSGLLLVTWLGCFAILTATAFPTVRLLLPFDPILIAGFALGVKGPARPDDAEEEVRQAVRP